MLKSIVRSIIFSCSFEIFVAMVARDDAHEARADEEHLLVVHQVPQDLMQRCPKCLRGGIDNPIHFIRVFPEDSPGDCLVCMENIPEGDEAYMVVECRSALFLTSSSFAAVAFDVKMKVYTCDGIGKCRYTQS